MSITHRLRDRLRQGCGALVLWWLRRVGSRPFVLTNAKALIVAPHPDDETLGCGGLIALKRARGAAVHVAFLTDGGDGKTRRAEALEALAVLGVGGEEVTFLGGVDGALASLAGGAQAALVARIGRLLVEFAPGEVFVPHRQDVHTDHEAAYELVRQARMQTLCRATLWEYAIWLLWWKPIPGVTLPADALAGAHRLPIGPVWGKKQQAIACHPSQMTERILPRAFLKRFSLKDEIFFGPGR